MRNCIHCGAPRKGDSKAGQPVPLCLTIQKLDANRTETCRYIEELRRTAEDLDTAVMGIDSGILLGGTHLSPPLEFGRTARERYEQFGEFLLDQPVGRGGGSCECGGDESLSCNEYSQFGPQACRAGTHRFEAAQGMWSR
jgi:hypothetical protein